MASNAQVGLRVFLDDALSSGLSVLNLNMGNFGMSLMNLASFAGSANSQLTSLIPLFAALGGAQASFEMFSTGLTDAMKAGEDLQDTLISAQIAMHQTDQQMQSVGATITQIAIDTKFNDQEIGAEFERLAERGWSATDITNHLGQASADLAQTIKSDTVPAADLLGRTMQVMGASADQAGYYASALAFAFYNGIPSVTELSTSIDQVAEQARALNTPLDELIPILDYLNQNGLKASDAANSLRYMLASLESPTQKATQELANLGIITLQNVTPAFDKFMSKLDAAAAAAGKTLPIYNGTYTSLLDIYNASQKLGATATDQNFLQWAKSMGMLNTQLVDSHGNFKSLFDILDLIGSKMKGLTQDQQLDVLNSLFTVRGGKGAGLLLDNIDQTMRSLKGIKNDMDVFTKSGGAAQDSAKKMSSFSASLEVLGGTLQSFQARMGMVVDQFLTPFVNKINDLVGATTKAGPGLSQFGAVFLGVGTGLSATALIVGVIIAVLVLFGGALAPIIGIVLAVIAGIALLSAGIAALVVNWDKLFGPGTLLGQVFYNLTNFVKQLWTSINNVTDMGFGDALGAIKQAWAELLPALKQLLPILGAIGAVVGGLLIGVFTGLAGMIGPLANGLAKVLGGAMTILAGIINFVVGILKFFWNIIVAVFALFHGDKLGAFEAFKKATAGLGQAVQGVGQVFKGIFQIIWGTVSGVLGAVAGFIMGFIGGIIKFFQHLFDVLVGHSIIPDLIKSIWNWFASLPGKAIGAVQNMVSGIINAAKSIGGAIHDHIIQPIQDKFNSLVKMALDWGGNLIHMFIQGFQNAIGGLYNAVTGAAQWIKDHLGIHSPSRLGPLSESHTWMPNMMKMFASGITSNLPLLQGSIGRVTSTLSGTFGRPSSIVGSGSGSGGAGQTVINFQLDGKNVSSAVIDHLTNTLALNGAVRVNR